MNTEFWLPLLVLGSSLLTGILIFFMGEERQGLRTILNMSGSVLKLAGVGYISWWTLHGSQFEARIPIALGFDFLIRVDLLSLMFVILSSVLWFITTIYAIGYLEGSPHRSRFFGFFSLESCFPKQALALENSMVRATGAPGRKRTAH